MIFFYMNFIIFKLFFSICKYNKLNCKSINLSNIYIYNRIIIRVLTFMS